MAKVTQTRRAAGKYAEDFTNGEDPDGNQAERLVSDETFGTLAHCLDELETLERYGDDTADIDEYTLKAADRLRDALVERADELLEVSDDGE